MIIVRKKCKDSKRGLLPEIEPTTYEDARRQLRKIIKEEPELKHYLLIVNINHPFIKQ